jgi:hypothetical protein
MGLETAGEAALVGPADRTADPGDRLVGVQEQDGGVFEVVGEAADGIEAVELGAELAQVGHGRKPGGGVEQPDQVARGAVQLAR